MFERLIESEPESADFKNRRRYFLASSLVVGVLFAATVVVSIFAANFDLGSGNLELVEMVAPIDMAAAQPDTSQPQNKTQAESQTESKVPSRQTNTPRMVESPVAVPAEISVTQHTQMARPRGYLLIDRSGPNSIGPVGSGRDAPTSDGNRQTGLAQQETVAVTEPEAAPPTIVKKPERPKLPKSGGVVNGNAKSLPTPAYSATAKLAGAHGTVNVQVLIDENGNVISAHAIDGHPLLRGSAEQAARRAKFTPTLLTGVPVKVTGVIVYNFTR